MHEPLSSELEPKQLELLKTLAQANDNVPDAQRRPIRGARGDGVLRLSHPGFPEGHLVPNDHNLGELDTYGLIRLSKQAKNTWVVDILPAGRRYLATLTTGNRPPDVAERSVPGGAALASQQPDSGDPRAEAMNILDRVIHDVEDGSPDLERVLRRCSRAARLMGQRESAEIFAKEITGYSESDEPPYYRLVYGSTQWKSIASDQLFDPSDTAARAASSLWGTPARQSVTRAGTDGLRSGSTTGWWTPAQDVDPQKRSIGTSWVEPVEYYPPHVFSSCLRAIEQMAYDWAVNWLVFLRYENRITSIWQRYRSSVDAKLEEISLTNHLKSIDQNLASDNEQDWRNALYGCRSVLQDVANYLWRDERETYTPIEVRSGDGKKGPMRVTRSEYVNRIQAYLHQKSTKGVHTDLLEAEAEYLGALFARLNRLDNHAHAGATRELAESAAIQTYVLLAELIRRTDLVPMEQYEE